MRGNGKVTKLAIASRVIILVMQFASNVLIPDHNPDVFKSPRPLASLLASTDPDTILTPPTFLDEVVEFVFGGLSHWDAEYFLHIAEHSYSYENMLAFFPLYPMVIRTVAKPINYFGLGMSMHSLSILVGILINIYCFCRAANCLFELTQKLFGDVNKSWNATVMFCFNPASIFFTALYTESLFCWLTFYLMLECVSQMELFNTVTNLASSMVCRSNGLLNIGFPVYFILRKMLLRPTQKCWMSIKMITTVIVSLIPFTFYNFYAFQLFCTKGDDDVDAKHSPEIIRYAIERDYILAGNRIPTNSHWCDKTFPFPYSYIQSHYWNVGLFKYYELKQLPNFLLAAPIIGFMLYQCVQYLRCVARFIVKKSSVLSAIEEFDTLPFVIHSLFLTVFCVLMVHIQVSTRLIASASPCLYWFVANILPKTFDKIKWRSTSALVLLWFSSYYVLGTILFSNFLPWT